MIDRKKDQKVEIYSIRKIDLAEKNSIVTSESGHTVKPDYNFRYDQSKEFIILKTIIVLSYIISCVPLSAIPIIFGLSSFFAVLLFLVLVVIGLFTAMFFNERYRIVESTNPDYVLLSGVKIN